MRYNQIYTDQKPRGLLPSRSASHLPPGGRLLRVIPPRIVGSGFCLIVRGRPRAMLAPDASVGKAELTC